MGRLGSELSFEGFLFGASTTSCSFRRLGLFSPDDIDKHKLSHLSATLLVFPLTSVDIVLFYSLTDIILFHSLTD